MPFYEQTRPIEVLAALARTAGSTSTSIDRNSHGRAQTFTFLLSVGLVSGTAPSLGIAIEHSDDGSTGWTAITGGAFTATTAAAFKELTVRGTKRFLRAVITMTGTTPSFTMALICVAGDPLDSNI